MLGLCSVVKHLGGGGHGAMHGLCSVIKHLGGGGTGGNGRGEGVIEGSWNQTMLRPLSTSRSLQKLADEHLRVHHHYSYTKYHCGRVGSGQGLA